MEPHVKKRDRMQFAMLCVALSGAIAACLICANLLTRHAFDLYETSVFKQNMHLAIKYLDQQKIQLEKLILPLVTNPSEFELYRKSPELLKNKIALISKEEYPIQYAAVFGPDYQPLFGFEKSTGKFGTWKTDEIKMFAQDDSFLDFKERGGIRSGLIIVNDKLYLIAAKQIVSGEHTKVLGTIAIATPWSNHFVSHLEQSIDTDIKPIELNTNEIRNKYRSVLSQMTGSTVWTISYENERMTGYLAVYDSMENPVMILEMTPSHFDHDRIVVQIERMIWALGFILLAMSIFALSHYQKKHKELEKVRLNYKVENDKLNSLMETIPGYVSWLDKDLKYISVSKKLADVLGKEPEDFLGRKVGTIIREDAKNFLEKIILSSNKGETSEVFKHTLPSGNGLRHVITVVQKFKDRQEYVIVGIDITDVDQDILNRSYEPRQNEAA